MVARVARFEGVNIVEVETSMGEVEAIILPLVEGLSGYKGVLHLWSLDGDMLTITLFESEADAQAAEPTFDNVMPEKLGRYFQSWDGRRVSVGLFNATGDLV